MNYKRMRRIGSWTISAAGIQGAVTGHAYWIAGDATLLDAGTSISAANPTNQPPGPIDVSWYEDVQWSLFYGAQTGNVGGKIGIAELWPTTPVDVINTIPPYVRDVASHWLVTGGLGFVLQGSIPASSDEVLSLTSQTATGIDSGPLDTADFGVLYADAIASAGTTALVGWEIATAGGARQLSSLPAAGAQEINWGPGAGLNTGLPANLMAITGAVSPRVKFTTTSAGVGNTVTLRVLGERKRPLRRPKLIAPYVQWVNPGTGGAAPVVPTAGSQPIYLQLWGRLPDGAGMP